MLLLTGVTKRAELRLPRCSAEVHLLCFLLNCSAEEEEGLEEEATARGMQSTPVPPVLRCSHRVMKPGG